MKLKSVLLGTAFAVACGGAFGGTAQAAHINGWYLGLEGGANWIEDWSYILDRAGNAPAETVFDTGWVVLATVGYSWNSHFRLEFEAGYRDNDVDAILVSGSVSPLLGGNLWEASAMVNVLYDVHVTDKMSLSLGAGAGGDFANSTYFDLDIPASAEDDEWHFAYQGIAGINYMVGQRTALFMNYRYLRVTNPEFNYQPALNAIQRDGDDLVKHAATIGIRYALHSSQPYVGAAPAAEATSSAPPRQFIVFFGFNKYNLTSEATRVISEAVNAAKETGSATIVITGHTDTVGSPIYNDRLSLRRSNAVKAEMVRQGVSTSSISASGRGETELLVQTADAVKEPQNRRATIDLN
jgi:OmpA-OmpF porin, OOP family